MSYLTEEEFYTLYGDVEVEFTNYFKYVFSYGARLKEGFTLVVECGGDADEIYRHEVSNKYKEKVKALEVVRATVYKDGKPEHIFEGS